MIFLGIDTASAQCAVALVRDGACLASASQPGRQGQAERLLPMIEACLREAGITFAALGGVTVATGPGSFTGLRVGLAAAQGLALACTIPELGIDSFTACRVSNPVPNGQPTLIILESFRTELYWQLFDAAGTALTTPACSEISTIVAALPAGPLTVIGDGAGYLAEALAGRVDCLILPPASPDPAAIAREGMRLLAQGLCPPATACYVRPADAKPR